MMKSLDASAVYDFPSNERLAAAAVAGVMISIGMLKEYCYLSTTLGCY